ncbi:hypothetical protein CA54_02350 [Symmachiella macrocystis]|uniref:Uncharacterized protein n=1 Tax=Symmachiella macrocystis TaxID=2527985 RepID=A0A5C6BHA9_9PLAN|nr:hypothetical protein [Symmachiella macrocystis]TWU11428.1 hypothetical protein CA54_02350 [Symmachiella macrocystis]
MGHSISAVVVAGEIDAKRAREFDVKTVPCLKGFTVIALEPAYVDAWAERLGIHDDVADVPLLNSCVVHHIVQSVAGSAPFAVIQTDYFGGVGLQAAAVYQGTAEIMAPATTEVIVPNKGPNEPINRALKILGVRRRFLSPLDHFATLGMCGYRDFDDLFEDYYGNQ